MDNRKVKLYRQDVRHIRYSKKEKLERKKLSKRYREKITKLKKDYGVGVADFVTIYLSKIEPKISEAAFYQQFYGYTFLKDEVIVMLDKFINDAVRATVNMNTRKKRVKRHNR
jgi:hypothetical protein